MKIQAEICLLLSHWGPYSFETEVNQYWADLAMHKASQACTGSSVLERERLQKLLLWKCCENRRRILAFYHLLPADASQAPADLGRDSSQLPLVAASITLPNGYGSKDHDGVVKVFQRTCELAEIMSMICALRDQEASIKPVEQMDIMNVIRDWDKKNVDDTQILPRGSENMLTYQCILFLRQ